METNSHYGSNRITRTWVWRADRVASILDDAFWGVDNMVLEQEILEAIKIMKGFRDLILEDDFISDDIYPEDYIDGNTDYITRTSQDDNDNLTDKVRLRIERRWQDGIRRSERNETC